MVEDPCEPGVLSLGGLCDALVDDHDRQRDLGLQVPEDVGGGQHSDDRQDKRDADDLAFALLPPGLHSAPIGCNCMRINTFVASKSIR